MLLQSVGAAAAAAVVGVAAAAAVAGVAADVPAAAVAVAAAAAAAVDSFPVDGPIATRITINAAIRAPMYSLSCT